MADELSLLRPLSWRGIVVPCIDLTTEISNDEIEHKKPNRNGVEQEPTGNNADVVNATTVFLNKGTSLMPPRYADPLYPVVHRAFMDAMRDPSVGTLVHPERGEIQAVPLRASSRLSGSVDRDGARVTCTWREDSENALDFGAPSALSAALVAASDVDSQLEAIRVKAANQPLPPQGFSFSDSLRQIRAIADQTALVARRGEATFARVQFQLDQTRDAIRAAKDASLNSARISVERLQAAIDQLQSQLFSGTAKVGRFLVRIDSTLASIAKQTGTTVTDLVGLNQSTFPDILRDAVVRAGVVLRFTVHS